jgi:hypothetical protein
VGWGRRRRRRGRVGRVLAGLVCAGLVAAALVLMFTDRAPGTLSRLSDRVERSERTAARVLSEARTPESDTEVHLAIWAAVTLTGGLAAGRRRRVLPVAAAVLVLATAVELAQEHVTARRTTQTDDLIANVAGVALGAAILWLWFTAARWLRSSRSPRAPRSSPSVPGGGRRHGTK